MSIPLGGYVLFCTYIATVKCGNIRGNDQQASRVEGVSSIMGYVLKKLMRFMLKYKNLSVAFLVFFTVICPNIYKTHIPRRIPIKLNPEILSSLDSDKIHAHYKKLLTNGHFIKWDYTEPGTLAKVDSKFSYADPGYFFSIHILGKEAKLYKTKHEYILYDEGWGRYSIGGRIYIPHVEITFVWNKIGYSSFGRACNKAEIYDAIKRIEADIKMLMEIVSE